MRLQLLAEELGERHARSSTSAVRATRLTATVISRSGIRRLLEGAAQRPLCQVSRDPAAKGERRRGGRRRDRCRRRRRPERLQIDFGAERAYQAPTPPPRARSGVAPMPNSAIAARAIAVVVGQRDGAGDAGDREVTAAAGELLDREPGVGRPTPGTGSR